MVLVKELTGIVLTVDRDQPGAQGAQGGDRYALTVDPAGVASVGQDLPLDQQLVLHRDVVLLEPVQGRDLGEDGADKGVIGPGADHLAVGPLAEDGGDGVDDDGFSRAGFARQNVKAPAKANIGLLDHGDILNVEQRKHGSTSFSAGGVNPAAF